LASFSIKRYVTDALPKFKAVKLVTVIKLTQITDLHLGSASNYKCRGLNTFNSLQSVLSAIKHDGRGDDRLILTGDIASDGQPGAYQQLDQLLSSEEKQALWLPGNHDDMDRMQQHLIHYPFIPVFESGNWAILMLDSCMSGRSEGKILSWQMQQLEWQLERLADKYLMVAMHHSPVLVKSQWLDQHRIANHKQLHQLLISHAGVKAVINGHVHQQYEADWDGLPVYSAPSTCFQFKSESADFALGDQPPAYRWIDLHDDGQINTGVKFLQPFSANA